MIVVHGVDSDWQHQKACLGVPRHALPTTDTVRLLWHEDKPGRSARRARAFPSVMPAKRV